MFLLLTSLLFELNICLLVIKCWSKLLFLLHIILQTSHENLAVVFCDKYVIIPPCSVFLICFFVKLCSSNFIVLLKRILHVVHIYMFVSCFFIIGTIIFCFGKGSILFKVALNKLNYSCSFFLASEWSLQPKKLIISIFQFTHPPFARMTSYNFKL